MNPGTVTSFASIAVSLLTAAGLIYTAWSSRATARRRDAREDFEVITESLRTQVSDVRADLAHERRIRQVLTEYVRILVAQMRERGIEPPAAPKELHEV